MTIFQAYQEFVVFRPKMDLWHTVLNNTRFSHFFLTLLEPFVLIRKAEKYIAFFLSVLPWFSLLWWKRSERPHKNHPNTTDVLIHVIITKKHVTHKRNKEPSHIGLKLHFCLICYKVFLYCLESYFDGFSKTKNNT